MAYFANGSEGMAFEGQCEKCLGAEKPCPVAFVQWHFNYDAVNNKLAREILDHLVLDGGTCLVFKTFEAQLSAEDRSESE